MKRRILFFIESGGPGGAERVVLQLLEGFRSLGHEVFLATLRTGWLTETATMMGFKYHQIRSDKRLDFLLPYKIASLVRILKVDVIHSHLLDSNFYASIAARLCGISHVGTEHGDIHHIDKKKFLRLKLYIASSGRSRLTSVSEYSLKKLLSLGVHEDRCSFVPNPLRDPLCTRERGEIRDSLNIGSEWLWLHIGNLRPVKDQSTLIKGFAYCARLTNEQQKLLIVGGGDELDRLKKLVGDLEIQEKVIFTGHSNEVENYLLASDGFIMSSLSESMPMALLEAISYSLYPICSSVGGIPEILSEEQTFLPGDYKKLGELCATVLEDRKRYKSIAEEFSNRMLAKRSLSAVCEQYLRLYSPFYSL